VTTAPAFSTSPHFSTAENRDFLFYLSAADQIRAVKQIIRLAHHREFTGYDPMDPEHFDLMPSSAMQGADGTAAMSADIARKRFSL